MRAGGHRGDVIPALEQGRAGWAQELLQTRILLIGPYPPPYGGVSTHLREVVELLTEYQIPVQVLPHNAAQPSDVVIGSLKRNPLRYFVEVKRHSADIKHYHHSRWWHLLAISMAASRDQASYLVTFHNPDVLKVLKRSIPGISLITRKALSRFDVIIGVSDEITEGLRTELPSQMLATLPAYIGVKAENNFGALDAEAHAFMRAGDCLLISAYRLDDPVYGIDTAIEALGRIAKRHPRAKLAIYVALSPTGFKRRSRYIELRRLAERNQVEDRILWRFECTLMPALRVAKVYLRPTRSDGDSVSVREALNIGLPVVASDAVPRPNGCRLFQTGDANSLSESVCDLLNLDPGRLRGSPVATGYPTSYFGQLLEHYLWAIHPKIGRTPSSDEG